MQKNLDVNLSEIKTKTREIDLRVTKLHSEQVHLEEKVGDLAQEPVKSKGKYVTKLQNLSNSKKNVGID